ncbi:hypothetical protein FRZ40_31940 [Paraburkholderia azotifigens]|uniref:Uncharacterized protein n=1 Tax=Paraburkholderia azotifigens TaxID=2057004 RepID=A0A5C6V059_9BURK|nr:hypothetical protein FRZ40_31940 [Paraburkholderia azotifigens]
MGTNTMIEQDIMHVEQVLRAFVFRWTPDATILAYWRNRLYTLFQSPHLNDYQRHWVQELIHELHEFERRKFARP